MREPEFVWEPIAGPANSLPGPALATAPAKATPEGIFTQAVLNELFRSGSSSEQTIEYKEWTRPSYLGGLGTDVILREMQEGFASVNRLLDETNRPLNEIEQRFAAVYVDNIFIHVQADHR